METPPLGPLVVRKEKPMIEGKMDLQEFFSAPINKSELNELFLKLASKQDTGTAEKALVLAEVNMMRKKAFH